MAEGGKRQHWRGETGLEKTGSARRKVYVPLKRRAKRFLEALELCGNVSMAIETAGLGKDRVYLHRKENQEFARGWEAALAAFRERAEADEGFDEAALEADGLVLRRGRGGRVQIVSRRPNQWTAKTEEIVLAHLAATGNVQGAARAAGVSAKSIWERRLSSAGFGRRMDEMRDEAAQRLEWKLIEEGANLLSAGEGGKADPSVAMWLLKRRDQAAAGQLKLGAARPRTYTFEESIELLDKRLRALGARRDQKAAAAAAGEGGAPAGGEGGEA